MGVHIEIQASQASKKELEALAAFVAVMRGVEVVGAAVVQPTPAPAVEVVVPTGPVIATPAPTPVSAADTLMAAEAARVAAMPKPAPVVPPEGVEIDVTGLPWDERIHASTKVKNADGSWRNRRGVDADLVARISDDLRSVMAAPVPVAAEAPPPPIATDPAAAFAPPPPVAAPAPPVAETAPAPAPMAEFPRIMKLITEKQTAGTVTTELVRGIAVQLGLTGVADLAKRPDLIPAFEAMLP